MVGREKNKIPKVNMKLSIIIPCFNEIKTIEKVIDRINKIKIKKEIIIVDDCSSDGSRELIKKIKKIL